MEYKLPKEVQDILEKVSKADFQIYIVGGAVRDLLMKRPVTDWDFTTDAKPEEILKIFPDGFYDNKFGTVGVESSVVRCQTSNKAEESLITDSEVTPKEGEASLKAESSIFEITTMRKEGIYQDFRHPIDVSWTNKIEEDLARRDFTINAIALSEKGMIDPFHGCQDIQSKLIKAVGNPDQRFKEDALRLMRAIRIATQLGFEIEEKTFAGIKNNAHLISEVSTERIRDELFKILASNNHFAGIVKLRETGILQIILSEVEKTFGVAQEGPKHARVYDIGEHSFLTLKEIPSSDPLVRLAALIHDIGKTDTVKVEENGNVTFYQHEVVGSRKALEIAKRLHLSKKQTDKLFRLVRWHLFTVDEGQTDSAIRRFIKNVGVENIDDMMALRVGDRLGGGTQRAISWRMERFTSRIHQVLKKPFAVTDLKISGKDVMKVLTIGPGPKIGEILNKLFEEVLEDASKNTREYLLDRIKDLA